MTCVGTSPAEAPAEPEAIAADAVAATVSEAAMAVDAAPSPMCVVAAPSPRRADAMKDLEKYILLCSGSVLSKSDWGLLELNSLRERCIGD